MTRRMSSQAIELSRPVIQRIRENALRSLWFFARGVLGFDYMTPRVHKPLCEFLERPSRRKRITLPRGFLKTSVVAIAYPLWRAVKNPNIRVLIAMKTLPNAMRTISQIRSIVERNELFRLVFPEVVPASSRETKWSDEAATLKRDGVFREATFEAAGIGTTLTSRHYDIIIEDDLVAPDKDNITGLEAMPTREEIEKAIGWHKLATSLLADPGKGEIINVGTRWSKYDLIQYIIDNEPAAESFELAAYDENGQPTYPERFPEEVLREIEEIQGTYIFSSQYLNRPYDEARMVFRDEWIQTWDRLPEDTVKVIIVDPAISQKSEADFSVVLVAGACGRTLYAVDYRRGHFTPSEIIDHMFDLAAIWGVRELFVEAVQWQEALVHFFELKCKELGKWLSVTPIRPGRTETKEMRIRGLQPFAQRGDLKIASWMRELRVELRDFPFAKTRDIADALAYAPRVLEHVLRPPARVAEARPRVETVGDVIDALRRRGTMRWGFAVGHMPRSPGWIGV